jgi:hypothetical protein
MMEDIVVLSTLRLIVNLSESIGTSWILATANMLVSVYFDIIDKFFGVLYVSEDQPTTTSTLIYIKKNNHSYSLIS